ncbi:hypothetical protein [Desulfosoma sp.]
MGAAEKAEAWRLAIRRALRSRQGLADFLDKIHSVLDLPEEGDAVFLKSVADYCRFGTPLPQGRTLPSLSGPARMMADVLADKAGLFPFEKASKELSFYFHAPEKIMPRHYHNLAVTLAGHPTMPKVLETLADLFAQVRTLNHKRFVQEGPKLLGQGKHFRKIDAQVRATTQFLPQNLSMVLLHPFRFQLFQACHRMARHITGPRLKEWLDTFPFLLRNVPGVDLGPILEGLEPPIPTREDVLALRKEIPFKSIEETAALIPLIRRWESELRARADDTMLKGHVDSDPELALRLLPAVMADIFQHLVQRLHSELESADPRERARCGVLVESLVLREMDFLEKGFPSPRELTGFLEKVLALSPRRPRLPLLYAGLCHAHDLTTRRQRALEALEKAEPLTIHDVDWCFEGVKDPCFHLHVMDIFLKDPQNEVVEEYARRVAYRVRQALSMHLTEQFHAYNRFVMLCHPLDKSWAEYTKKLQSILSEIPHPGMEPIGDLLESFPGGVWSEDGYFHWLRRVCEKNKLDWAIRTLIQDVRRFVTDMEANRNAEDLPLTLLVLAELYSFFTWMIDHPKETLTQAPGALAELFETIEPIWESLEMDSVFLVRLHNALAQWADPPSPEIQKMAKQIRTWLRQTARPKKFGGSTRSRRFEGRK